MAIDLEDEFPGGVGTATASYPFGVPRNVSAPAAGDGTPWEDRIVKDIYGFFAALLTDAGITPSGSPDSALASQYLQAIQALAALPLGGRSGLRDVQASDVLVTTEAGAIRNRGDTRNLYLAADMQKDFGAVWAQGAAGGAFAASAGRSAGLSGRRKFLVNTPEGVGDFVYDDDDTASNFFASAAASSAGFTDATLYRRIGWGMAGNGSGVILTRTVNEANNLNNYLYAKPDNAGFLALAGAPISADPREALALVAPPNTEVRMMARLTSVNAAELAISTYEQPDPTGSPYGGKHIEKTTAAVDATIDTAVLGNDQENPEIFVRCNDSAAVFVADVYGWIDNLDFP